MTYLLAVGITVGILAGVWVYASGVLALIGFAGFLGWASYFAAGGGKKGVVSALCSNLSGVLWGFLTVLLIGALPMVPPLVFTILFAAIMCWQAKIPLLAFIPGTFIGNAVYYATGNDVVGSVIGLVIGVFLGIASDVLAKMLSKKKES